MAGDLSHAAAFVLALAVVGTPVWQRVSWIATLVVAIVAVAAGWATKSPICVSSSPGR